jgi:ATP-dependent Clp protease adaptor protein ClpS
MGSKEQHELDNLFGLSSEEQKALILYNDDHNYFEFVIESLVKVCDHTEEQAEQCAMIVHFKGKCDVKQGEYEVLNPMREALTQRGLSATIE